MTLTTNYFQHLLGIAGLITVILMVMNVYLSAQVAQDGLMIDSLSQKQEALKNDIVSLEQQYTSRNSLADLSQEAVELGYQKANQVVTLTNTSHIVARQ